ncbi:lysophospholipase [bacterium]|nr:lysophospholipase [bacterium]
MRSDPIDHIPAAVSGFSRRTILRGMTACITVYDSSLRTATAAAQKKVRIVTLGDSITKGVRPGVTAAETFAALLQKQAEAAGYEAEVQNVGIGGERTDQALERLDRDVLAKSPDIVTVMYGANDSYVDPGKTAPRLSPEQFRENLERLVDRLQATGARVVLMTEPRWGAKPNPNGLGEHPNIRLDQFMILVRAVASAKMVPLVDHFEEWTRREKAGLDIATVTTDLLHPNPAGHRLLANALWPVLEPMMKQLKDRS